MASSQASQQELEFTIGEAIGSILEAYEQMEMPVRQYVLFVLVPSAVFFALTVVAAILLSFPLSVRLPIPMIGLLIVISAAIYPKIIVSQRRVEIDNKFHLLITHMTVLSTTNIDRMEVFRTLSKEEEYGALTEEIRRIAQLVDTWNQSLDDACRRRAQLVPSKPLSDFLDRLAYTLGAGQELSVFMVSEQDVMIQNYVTVYEGALSNLEVMEDLYLSMILSMTFALVFAIVLPILTGVNPTLTVGAVIVLFIFVQIGFYLVIRTMAPFDPVWYHPDELVTGSERRIQVSMIVASLLVVLLLAITAGGLFNVSPIGLEDIYFFMDPLPLPFYLATPITPLLIPGFVLRSEENRIQARDDEFPNFIRALGASESAKQSTTSSVLSTLRSKNFGPLTEDVDNLYKRLNMRLSAEKSWRFFAAETRSYLIQKFSEMYLVGRQMGGEPKQLGELISSNMNTVNQLREQRRQATVTLIGLLYGITAASAFAFFIGLEVVNILSTMSADLGTSGGNFDYGQLLHAGVYNIPLIEYLLLLIILFNAVLSSLMIREVDGGHKANAYIHFVLLTWIGSLVAYMTRQLIGNFLVVQ